MKTLKIYQVDAFASSLFRGNPAAVCPLQAWLPDDILQAIASENNLSETAFFVPAGEGFHLRWFTPNEEIELCGHATLASAHVLFEKMNYKRQTIPFTCLSGELRVERQQEGLVMDFPALPYEEISWQPDYGITGLPKPEKILKSRFDLMFVYGNEADVALAKPNLDAVAQLDYRGLILTAPASKTDVYSRCFYPGCDVPEDPVTGSAHCVIAPYWCEQLAKNTITASQGGRRLGELRCEVKGDRVFLSGTCQLYLEGIIYLPE
ncbi:PhzF family phenazine biosynthesis protein [Legionella erythra]|uniref:Epimerase n=1 Tax=Legionella erythra TaxID=448 RepID=A0A0W0TLX9_LEGER|nr:PhzF family phenazine biosynthesis protein [Legionella erythra]KTC96602.1 epimerase [Legionella erythra]